MDPITLALLASAVPAVFQGIKGVQQTHQAKEMQKNLGPRVNYQIPEAAKQALSMYQNMAVSRSMPGQQLMQNMIDMQQAKALGGASRAATSSQDLLGVATQLGEKGMEQQQELGIQAAQNYMGRQQNYANALGTMAGYQEKVNADKQQAWYENAQRAAAMRQAGLENTMGAVQGIGQLGMMGLMGGFGEKTPGTTTRKETLSNIDKMNALSNIDLSEDINPTGYVAPAMSNADMVNLTGMNNSGGWMSQSPYGPYKSGYQLPASTISAYSSLYKTPNPYVSAQPNTWAGFGNPFFNF